MDISNLRSRTENFKKLSFQKKGSLQEDELKKQETSQELDRLLQIVEGIDPSMQSEEPPITSLSQLLQEIKSWVALMIEGTSKLHESQNETIVVMAKEIEEMERDLKEQSALLATGKILESDLKEAQIKVMKELSSDFGTITLMISEVSQLNLIAEMYVKSGCSVVENAKTFKSLVEANRDMVAKNFKEYMKTQTKQ